ncbi:unnamed protein product [Rotaria socialis]|uniref:Late endosomal/lysosomal adaptor and MAPK and MTOR activator 5 n=1 Tax=Rotaria socialis TaxID=392032 RepID=A0A820Z7K1_9BILA|nr:unnamed protein product [Rotaria socialis]CAF3425411.1 unnamed protein product [Rotaria socialis]CAF3441401.1 unnamed protein product [Rotaria socialis]CAF3529852.1 unnamed protein product [Rotaria socialis]CAF3620076.1 unnamed protein product [Rotaria socialis]
MHGNNMGEVIDTFITKVATDFKSPHTNITGVFITDNNGLILASQNVKNDCSGAIALLADLASTLLERPAIVCLENGDHKIIIREAGKAVFSIYTEATRR